MKTFFAQSSSSLFFFLTDNPFVAVRRLIYASYTATTRKMHNQPIRTKRTSDAF